MAEGSNKGINEGAEGRLRGVGGATRATGSEGGDGLVAEEVEGAGAPPKRFNAAAAAASLAVSGFSEISDVDGSDVKGASGVLSVDGAELLLGSFVVGVGVGVRSG